MALPFLYVFFASIYLFNTLVRSEDIKEHHMRFVSLSGTVDKLQPFVEQIKINYMQILYISFHGANLPVIFYAADSLRSFNVSSIFQLDIML